MVLPALPAIAKSYDIAGADVEIVVEEDGALLITEHLIYDFDGSFTGAYRDIPLRSGESFEFVSVSDENTEFVPGGCAVLGCSSPAGTYGLDLQPWNARVVWHHASSDEQRTFQLVYRLRGVTRVYDDVADVQYKVWGDQWSVGADQVTANVVLPDGAVGQDILVFGHPYGVEGETSLGDDGASPDLIASDVPPYQFVEIRVVMPSVLLPDTSGATSMEGDGLEAILAEEGEYAEEANDARAAAGRGLLWGFIAFVVLTLGVGGLVYLRYGREPKVDYDREYEQEPPTDLTPAEVGVLLSQGSLTEKQFTATLFDLIRRGVVTAERSEVNRATWAGLRNEQITDLVIGIGDTEVPLRDFE